MSQLFASGGQRQIDAGWDSPDRTVDASTCVFPEKTWFIKNSGHFETDGVTKESYDLFLFADEELTCENAPIGRFTLRDKESFTLVEDTTSPEKNEKPSLLRSILNYYKALIETIKNLIAKLFW